MFHDRVHNLPLNQFDSMDTSKTYEAAGNVVEAENFGCPLPYYLNLSFRASENINNKITIRKMEIKIYKH